MFITFEGGDGTGKSTQARKLASEFEERGLSVVYTREPGGTPGAEEIRRLILSGSTDRWSSHTDLLLFNAARRDHLERLVWPALERGAIVICDRFLDTSRAYQGAASPAMRKLVDDLHELVIGFHPDLTFILDLEPQASLERGLERLNQGGIDEGRFEAMGTNFQDRVMQEFREIAASEPDRCRLIDATGSVDEVAARVRAHLPAVLRQEAEPHLLP